MTEAARFIEEIYAEKTDLGTKIEFAPKTLEIKKNAQGVDGIFATKAIPADTTIMSVNRTGSSLTVFRAFEEAREMLEPLGLKRFYMSNQFIIACALYQRWNNPETNKTDVLVTSDDLKAEYANSPMICFGTTELHNLQGINVKDSVVLLKNAETLDKALEEMKVDEHTFRALLAYVQSRAFGLMGVIPVFDWINSASKYDANVSLTFGENKEFIFIVQKDVEAGEELVWNYNNANAIDTWFAYGYVDATRPTAARIHLHLSEEDLSRLTRMATEKLNKPASLIMPPGAVDPNLWTYDLEAPSDALPSTMRKQIAIQSSVNSFITIRSRFRMWTKMKASESIPDITLEDLTTDQLTWGPKSEAEALVAMRNAIRDGLTDTRSRAETFKKSRFGGDVDLSPYIQMRETAAATWTPILEELEQICRVGDLSDYIESARRITGNPKCGEGNMKQILEELNADQPTLLVTLILKYLQGRKLI